MPATPSAQMQSAGFADQPADQDAEHPAALPAAGPAEYLEHANVTVHQLDAATRFLLAALPTWRVRGEGTMDWFGKPIAWRHVGTDTHYIALQGGGEGSVPHWQTHQVGVKHLGIVVPDLAALTARLAEIGCAPDHPGGAHPHRKSVYYTADDLVQVEFMQYLALAPAQRNDYLA